MKTKRGGDDPDPTRRPYKSKKARKDHSLASFLEQIQMQKTKRGGYAFTRRSHKSTGHNGGREITDSLTSGVLHVDSNQGVRTWISDKLKSDLSKNVASLALCHGSTVLFACSGIGIECRGHTSFLTSASLARALNDAKESRDNLKIEVRHEGNEVYQGSLLEYTGFSIVVISTVLDVNVGHRVEILSNGRVLALGRDISGKLMATSVILAGDLSASEDNECLTCNVPEACEGGPLFTFDGDFVGMGFFGGMERAHFISWGKILGWLKHTTLKKMTGVLWSKGLKGFRSGARSIGEKSNSHPEVYTNVHDREHFGDLDSMGYPIPPITSDDGMILVNTFEETFGDTYPEGVWCEFNKKALSNIDRYVVALASFNGEKRYFACTGFFIEWNGSTTILTSASLVRSSSDENKIDENLRIEVLLPKKRCMKGTLQHYSLHYNVALVSVDCRVVCPAIVRPQWIFCSKVAAVGRCFKSGALMAANGDVVSWTGTLDCTYIVRSSFKITKAGIGGPIVNMDGEVIGMNFYDRRIGTPFMPWTIIDIILKHFEEKSKVGGVGSDSNPSGAAFWKMDDDDSDCMSRWPVPAPCWRHPDDVEWDKSDDDDGDDGLDFELGDLYKKKNEDDGPPRPRYIFERSYGYINGMKIRLF